MKPVFCLGDICADLVLPLGMVRRSKRGEFITREETDVVFRHGGSVANTAAGLRALGIPVQFCGTVGDDAYGYALKEELLRIGTDVSCMAIDPSVPTLLIAIVVDEFGERTAFATHRTHASQHQVQLSQIPQNLCETIGWLHCSGLLLREEPAAMTQLTVMRRCHEAGIPVSLDINARIESRGDEAFYANLMQAVSYSDVLFGSIEEELPLIAGAASEQAIRALTQGGRTIVARAGASGATVYTDSATYQCPAFSVPVVDTIGAGDVYNAGFLSALFLGKSLAQANRYGNAAAAFCVMQAGGRACPSLSELEHYLSNR